jgi:2-oxoglutarate dehydrogenase complex dehydrogenase (E1) component-like enzyme
MSSLNTNVVAESESNNVEIDARIAELIRQLDATDTHTAEYENCKVKIAAHIAELQKKKLKNKRADIIAETEALKMKNTILRELIRRVDMIKPTPCSRQSFF